MIDSAFATSALAVWGAILSTVLAFAKVYELWRDRGRISTSYAMRDVEGGNTIYITNLSSKPINVQYWELFWRKREGLRRKETRIAPEDETGVMRIEPHQLASLHFAGEHYFAWGAKTIPRGRLYLRLHIAGRRRPVVRRIYDPAD